MMSVSWCGVVALIWLLLPVFADKQVPKITRQHPLIVSYGRSICLDAQHLKIEVPLKHRCVVSVIRDDPLTERTGYLKPDKFPCKFRKDTVCYVHFGSKAPSKDFAKLSVRVDSATQTILRRIVLDIIINFLPMEIVKINNDLIVNDPGKISTSINEQILQFVYDTERMEACRVIIPDRLDSENGLPRYGRLVNITKSANSVARPLLCSDFLTAGIRYQHTKGAQSPNRDYIPMTVEIHRQTGKIATEHFQVAVRIYGATKNQRPMASFKASEFMSVDQYVTKLITTKVLDAEDVETNADYLIFNITQPLGKGEGYIISTDDPYTPITSFYRKDIRDLKIAYKPPSQMTNLKSPLEVVFEVIDTEAFHSEPIRLLIQVSARNTLSPMVTKNKELTLFEGQSRIISSKENLQISDKDNIEDVKIYVVSGLRHGELYVNRKVARWFTPSDLDNETIIYQHDNSDTYSDNIILNATDGKQYVEFVFVINVIPVDDEEPVVVCNTGLELEKAGIGIIDEYSLRASDIDSDTSKLQFLVGMGEQIELTRYGKEGLAKPGLQAGFLMLRQKEQPVNETKWIKSEEYWIKTDIDSFTQEDIMLRKLCYVHNGVEVFEDRFYFHLVDNAEGPNQSGVNVFNIVIKQVDIKFPMVDSDCTMHAEVKDLSLIKLTRKMLWFTDTDSDDMKLVYTIKQAPYFVAGSNQTKHAGSIVLTDKPDIILTSFTQQQLRHHKISYKPPSSQYQYTDMDVEFKFSISDPAGHSVDNQIFSIRLHAVRSNVNPAKVIKLLVKKDGELYYPSNHRLRWKQFVIVALPTYGKLYKNGQNLGVGGSFSIDDISNRKMLYVQRNADGKLDEIRIREIGGREMATFQIQAGSTLKDTNADTGARNQPPSLVQVSAINVEEAGSAIITSQELQATDPDTDDLKIFFMVNAFPMRGELLVNGSVVNNFSQSDVINNLVVYRHGVEEIGVKEAHDFFNLTLSDDLQRQSMGETPRIGFTFHVRISPVDDKAPVIKVSDRLQVWEGGKVTVTTDHLMVTDADTVPDDVTCRIDVSPLYGFLENIAPSKGMEQSQAGILIMSFTARDLLSQRINYVQNNHIGIEPKMDLFALSCSDGLRDSHRHMMMIDIRGRNDEIPKLFLINFQVEEGQSMTIDSVLLDVDDADIPKDNLTIKLLKHPKHGVVVDRSKSPSQLITSFPFQKIKQDVITYNHDGTETTEDVLQFAVTDGLHEVRKDVLVNILPIDDETPRLVTNTGLGLTNIGETRMISSSALRAEDVDSPNDNLTYVVRSIPLMGQLTRYERTGRSYNLSRGSEFTQRDINRGMIFYTDLSVVAVARKEIRFHITDGKNSLVNQVFYIYMKPEDKVYPIVLSKGVQLKKGSSVTFNTDIITSTDPDSSDTKLEYYITKPPLKGIITMAEQPNIPISKFSQLQLAGHKVKYVHTSQDGSNVDSFQFEVSDGRHQVMRKFRISLLDGDNTRPVVKYSILTVSEGETKEITSFELKAEDPDNSPDTLVFSITQIPVNGFIMKLGKPTMTFTQEDIDNNLVSYQHDGTDTTQDSFSFTVSDGTHLDYYVYLDAKTLTRRPQTIEIDIQTIDNKTPQMIMNRGGTTLETIPGGGLGLCLSSDLLYAFDPDSNSTQVTYFISDPPNFGTLINIARGNESVTNFRQSDIEDSLIYFMLNKDEINATSDRFYFDLMDPGMNELPNQKFSLHWARISLDRLVYQVSEMHRSVVITLTRNGFLGESSFVGIRAIDGSARIYEDFVPNSAQQVQFNPGERYKTWVVLIVNDKIYEGSEGFTVQIHSPVMAIMSKRREAKITITDQEDKSVISVLKQKYYVEESSGLANVGLYRHGDISKQDQIWCVTNSGTAIGTYGSGIQSHSDFISKTKNKENVVIFQQGERIKNCSVQLIDDSLYEEDEDFSVYIVPSFNTVVSPKHNKSLVIIKPDANDAPRVFFDQTRYVVDENSDICEVTVKRAGSDLSKPSSVVIRSKKTSPVSAKANMDYIPVSKTLYFSPGVRTQTLNIVILDDLGQPAREGLEYFELALVLPISTRVAVPERALVVINDTHSDLPRIQFKHPFYTIHEEDGMLSAILVRSGDVSQRSAVRCYTRQMTARAGIDYYERSNSDDDVVIFEADEKTQECRVAIVDDSFYEGNEEFRLVLGQTQLQYGFGKSLIGKRSQTTVMIADNNDRSGIGFQKKRHFVNEGTDDAKDTYAKLIVVRNGDTSRTSQVRVYTKDGSAKADSDFEPLSKVLTFDKNVTQIEVKIKILRDDKREMREAFTVHLTKDSNRVALIESNKVIVYIQENLYRTGVTFPLIPTVVSLRDYDDISKAKADPIQGYPLICVTACDPKHPRYSETGSLCSRQSIDNTKTLYSWEVAAATGPDGVTHNFRSIDSQTFFASTTMITLDSIYFGPGSRVRCTARAITYENYKGLGSTSDPVTVSRKEGLCLPQQIGDIGSESFSAQITYTGLESPTHPNMIRIRVLVPHIDGMLPAISTKSLSNFEITLTADASRRGQHLCSNILDTHEVQTKSGFLTDHMTRMSGGTEPYQYSSELRGKSTLRFYRNLNLEACMWTFENHYTMSELVQECGGRIATDGQVHDLTRSHLSVRVPLYVSYIYHSPSALGGWMHFDHSSYLKMSFTYDTAVLWKDGIGTPEGSVLKGYLYPTGVVIRPQDKRLVVTFRTVARFRGTFILAREDQDMFSMVMSPDQPNLSFELKLLRSTPTYNSPEQMWQFMSEFSVRDYSGTYYIKLIPCTVTQDVKYSVPLKCNPRMPITFTLPIRFQQTSDPDAVEFNIRTQFFLLAQKDVWLSNETNKVMEQSDAAFSLGSIIYGRIMVDPQQSLGSAYHVSIEKIFVCSGLDGYIPQYSPDSGEYGCVADSELLSYRFKILDRGAPQQIMQKFRNVPFLAKLAIDDENAHDLVRQPNSDGFKFDSSPLFQVASGRQWYLHAIYTIRSSRSTTRGIGKRSAVIGDSAHVVHSLSKRSSPESSKEAPQGAAFIRSIRLVYGDDENDVGGSNFGKKGIHKDTTDVESSSFPMKWVLIVVISVCFILLVAVVVLTMLYRRKSRPVTAKVVEPDDQMQGTEV